MNAHFSTGHLSDPFGVFLDILFATTAGVAGTDEFGVVLEAGRDRFAAVGVALDELDHLCFFLVGPPILEGGDVGEDEGVAVVGVAGAIRGTCRGRFGDSRRERRGILDILRERRMLVLLQMWRQRLGHGQLPQPEMLETHAFLSRNSNKKVLRKMKNTVTQYSCHASI